MWLNLKVQVQPDIRPKSMTVDYSVEFNETLFIERTPSRKNGNKGHALTKTFFFLFDLHFIYEKFLKKNKN